MEIESAGNPFLPHSKGEMCPMFGEKCIYCSIEIARKPYTKIEKDPGTGLFRPVRSGIKRVEIGERCNNHGAAMVEDLHYCPRRWAIACPVKPVRVL